MAHPSQESQEVRVRTSITEAIRSLPTSGVGTKWLKVNLHVHAAGHDPQVVVDQALAAGLDLIAITDHQSLENCHAVAAAAAGTSLTVLPGIEVTTVEGVHLLALFPRGFSENQCQEFFGWLEIAAKGDTRIASKKRLADVIAKIDEHPGLVVAPHPFTADIGIFDRARKMGTRKEWLDSGLVQFLQLSDAHVDKVRFIGHDEHGNWVNRYVVATADEAEVAATNYTLAPFNRSDAHDPSEVGEGCSWFRMGEASIEGLRQVACEHRVAPSWTL